MLHVLIIGFFLRMSMKPPPERAAGRADPAGFTSTYRDVPIPPEGIAVDSLPLSGLRLGEGSALEVTLDCRYAVTRGSAVASLVSGQAASEGVVGCPATLDVRELAVPTALAAHYDPLGDLIGVVMDPLDQATVESIRRLQLARPRPGRQWQGAVIIRLAIDVN